MLQCTVLVSRQERDLLDAIRGLVYGEIFGADIDDAPKTFNVVVSVYAEDLIDLLRSGVQHIDVLTVEKGEPTFAEIDQISEGFRCRKKIKFPRDIAI